MEKTTSEPKKKSRLRKITRNIVNIGKTVYEIMRDGSFRRTSPKDSRRAKHKRHVAVLRAFYNQKAEATLMLRIRQNLDDYLRGRLIISKKRKNKGIMPKRRKFLASNA